MTSFTKKFTNFISSIRPLPDFYGDDFKKIYAFLKESRTWSEDHISQYKLERLQALIKHAETNVPYYRELFKKEGISSTDINSLEDYAKIPILTKNLLRENLESLKADNFDSYHPIRTETSGTTGKMTELYRSKYHEDFRRAMIWRMFNEFGLKFRDKRVHVNYPHSIESDSPVYQYDRILNAYSINVCHIMGGRFRRVYDAIRKIKPLFLWVHPNLFFALAEYMVDNDLEPIKVPIIAHYGETLYPYTRRTMQKAFPGKYVEYYGNRENSIAGWGYSDARFFEVSEYCHLEISDSILMPDKPEVGDIISTSLHNYAVPLIRYVAGDIGCAHGYTNPEVPYPVIELIGGRGKDMMLSRDGFMSPYFLSHLEHKKFDKISKYQMVQVDIDNIKLRIVPKPGYIRETDEPLLVKYVEKALQNKFKIRIQYEDDISFTKAGKAPSFVSKLAEDYLDSLA
jgi:phenylacetate-coenzyme A ligase PaaK-like adenylate-forming protein